MRKVRFLVALVLLMANMASVNAQRKVVKVYPKQGTVVQVVNRPTVVVHDRVSYRFADGVWYRPQGNSFVVCAAPVGIRVRSLPRGRRIVRIGGRKLYRYRGVHYQRIGGAFVVVQV